MPARTFLAAAAVMLLRAGAADLPAELLGEASPSEVSASEGAAPQFQIGNYEATLLQLPAFQRAMAAAAGGRTLTLRAPQGGASKDWNLLMLGAGAFSDVVAAAAGKTGAAAGHGLPAANLTGEADLFLGATHQPGTATAAGGTRWLDGSAVADNEGVRGGLWIILALFGLLLSQLWAWEKGERRKPSSSRPAHRSSPRSSTRRRP